MFVSVSSLRSGDIGVVGVTIELTFVDITLLP